MTDLTPARPAAGPLSVVVERDIGHPPERIWRALTQPHLMAEWLMANDFVPELGARFNLRGEWGGVLDCEVLEIEPHRTLAYSWNFDHPTNGLTSVVTWTLTPTAAGTRLRMEQTGFRRDQPQNFGGAQIGWRANFDRLEALLAGPMIAP
ncbi:SRPBCC family protein [Phenylobacterium soli]|uniref:Polyketide cyclase n=1 Tax=Phenylobacterium soli TaxID=2170551 RepID=A0A328ALX3_9CAUL|nr:SRPBCC domain-containing protein [Phenylobacterium soli]RAK54424.1 polyketide cyclase [Phenylobacterium soli]